MELGPALPHNDMHPILRNRVLRPCNQFHIAHAVLELFQTGLNPVQSIWEYFHRVRLPRPSTSTLQIMIMMRRDAHFDNAFLQQRGDLWEQARAHVTRSGEVRVRKDMYEAFVRDDFLYILLFIDDQSATRSEEIVGDVLGLVRADGVEGNFNGLVSNLLHPRDESVLRKVSVQNVRGSLVLQCLYVL